MDADETTEVATTEVGATTTGTNHPIQEKPQQSPITIQELLDNPWYTLNVALDAY